MSTGTKNDKIFIPLIAILSVAVPLVVAWLIFAEKPGISPFGDISFLPTLNAIINSTVSCLLILGLIFIKQKRIVLHKTVMISAFVLSICFLISYLIYHSGTVSVKYQGEGLWKGIYFFVLFSHILLSAAIVPLALLSIYRGLTRQFEKHKKITRWAWPIWLYVSVTGVLVYLMAHVYNY